MLLLLLFAAGIFAGFVDSIAGGGGLITLPVLSLAVAAGAHAIGTNKIVGTVGAIAALAVYARRGHLDAKAALKFSFFVAIGSWIGSSLTPRVSDRYITLILMAMLPILLWIIYNKEMWLRNESRIAALTRPPAFVLIALSGMLAGVYDGFLGPGGGTFMFLVLHFVAKLPLLAALAASKLANTFSAGTALVNFERGGYVHWVPGLVMAAGMSIGATLGARAATRQATRIVRPILIVVSILLMVRLAYQNL